MNPAGGDDTTTGLVGSGLNDPRSISNFCRRADAAPPVLASNEAAEDFTAGEADWTKLDDTGESNVVCSKGVDVSSKGPGRNLVPALCNESEASEDSVKVVGGWGNSDTAD